MKKKILLIAGETSGDLHGAHLIEAIRRIDPEILFFGMGGDHLKRVGMKLLYHCKSISVVGITEVLLKLRSIIKAFKILGQSLENERPDLIILIDFPDFNLRFAKLAQKKNIPVVYYISPQIWAWRPKRIRGIAKTVKKMIVLFNFELPIYKSAGVDVEWIGHPLLDLVKPKLSQDQAFQQFKLDPRKLSIALLPGSRDHEVKRLLPPLIEASKIIISKIPNLQFLIPLAPSLSKSTIIPYLSNLSFPITIVEGFTYDVMNISHLLITASGTATLEGAILKKPMIIVYKVSLLSYLLGRIMIKVNHIGLVNLVAGKTVVPELIQKDVNPKKIAEEALKILEDQDLYRKISEELSNVRIRLGQSGASDRAARLITSLLSQTKI